MKHITFDIETTGLHPWSGDRITCICAKEHGNEKIFTSCHKEEKQILIDFCYHLKWLTDKETILITKNGTSFDIPFIQTRLILNDMCICNELLNLEHQDIHLITKKWISLEDMAIILGFPENERKTGNGMMAIKLWHAKKYDELIEYCKRDVELTEKVFFRIQKLREENKK